jgi:hypothetical protein
MEQQGIANRINLTLFPTCLEMNLASDGQWAVGTNQGVIMYRHHEEENAERFNGQQDVVNLSFGGNGKKMIVSGHSEIMMFEI